MQAHAVALAIVQNSGKHFTLVRCTRLYLIGQRGNLRSLGVYRLGLFRVHRTVLHQLAEQVGLAALGLELQRHTAHLCRIISTEIVQIAREIVYQTHTHTERQRIVIGKITRLIGITQRTQHECGVHLCGARRLGLKLVIACAANHAAMVEQIDIRFLPVLQVGKRCSGSLLGFLLQSQQTHQHNRCLRTGARLFQLVHRTAKTVYTRALKQSQLIQHVGTRGVVRRGSVFFHHLFGRRSHLGHHCACRTCQQSDSAKSCKQSSH